MDLDDVDVAYVTVIVFFVGLGVIFGVLGAYYGLRNGRQSGRAFIAGILSIPGILFFPLGIVAGTMAILFADEKVETCN